MLIEILSTLSAGLFTGAAIYINMVEHPARMEGGTELAIPGFTHSYRRGAVFMGSLLLCGIITATAVAARNFSVGWLIGACLLLSLIPFTLAVIMPINRRLLGLAPGDDQTLTAALLNRWGRYHAVRSLLGLTSFLLFLYLLTRGSR